MTHTYRYLFFLFMVAAGFPSCQKDLLDTVPNDRISEDVFWQTASDAEAAVNSLYRDLDGTNIFAWDAFTDIAHVNQPFNVNAYIELGTYDASSSVILSEWSNAFTGIAADNYFLANADKVADVTDATTLARYKAEARFLRAYQYVKLATLFGGVPIVTAPLTIAEARALTRNSLSEVYDFVDTELTDIADDLPTSYTSSDIGRITQGAAWALKARADLYAGRYEAAATAARNVIDLNVYSLYSQYKTLFSYAAENNSEVILDKQFIASTYSNSVFYLLAPYSQNSSQSTFVPTKAGIAYYTTADGESIDDATSGYDSTQPYVNRDSRLGFSVFLDGDTLPSGAIFHPAPNSGTADAVGNTYIASTTGFNIKKYINASDYASPSNNGINIILIRYAEVLLTYAEAKIELDDIDQSVYDAINLVRNGRTDVQLPDITSGKTQAELRVLVRNERTVELAFEGLHLADIRRWKTAESVVPGNVYGITYLNDSGSYTTVQVAVSRVFNASKHYLWPIPQSEIDQDSYLEQNPNW
ncbi:MAG: RagB/SusD family nutrient uptake outer membrane protein [Chitinophagaceae bacterium]